MAQKKYVYIASSLDGYIAKSNGDVDWLEHDSMGEDYGFNEFLDKIDALVMGSNTLRKIISFDEWPYGDKKVIVLSHSLKQSDLSGKYKGKIEISRLKPKEILSELTLRNCRNIYIDGGKLIQSFLKEKLIDEITITLIPVLLGSGIQLFAEIDKEIQLELIHSESFKSGLLQINYALKY